MVAASFIIPAASGLWTADADPIAISGVGVGIVALGYILFGIVHHLAIALVGLGIAASYYLPTHFAGDAAPVGVGQCSYLPSWSSHGYGFTRAVWQ